MPEQVPSHVKPLPLRIGVTMSLTGPGDLDWTPVRQALSLWPGRLGGLEAEVQFADDQADPDKAAELAAQMIGRGAHALVQFSLSGPAFAVTKVAHRHRIPHFAMSPIEMDTAEADWTFRLAAKAALMAQGLLEHAARAGYRQIGFIGSADNYGGTWQREVDRLATEHGIRVAMRASYQRTDSALPAGIAAGFAAAGLDAVLIAGPGNTAPMPQAELRKAGYHGPVLQTFGADMRALAAGAAADFDGTIMPTGPGSAPHLLPKDAPTRALIEDFEARFRQAFGKTPNSQAAITTDDVRLILDAITSRALAVAAPGDVVAFRRALRDALLAGPIQTGSGEVTYTPDDRFGFGADARQLVVLRGGQWRAH